jgi:hypothetical protein
MERISWYLLTFLLNSAWQIPVIACIAALAAWLLRRGPANHRHAVWVLALVAAATLPIVSTSKVASQCTTSVAFTVPAPPQLGDQTPSRDTTPIVAAPGPLSRTIAYKQSTATTLALGYLLLFSLCFARLVRALVTPARIRRSGTVAIHSPVLRQVWTRCAESFGLSHVQLLASARIHGSHYRRFLL